MKAWIAGTFDTDLGVATITKVVVTTPASEDAISIVMTLTLSNGTTTKDAKVTVSPLPSKKSLDSSTTAATDKKAVDEVSAALTDLADLVTVSNKTQLPSEVTYDEFTNFLTDVNKIIDLKGTIVSLGIATDDDLAGTKTFNNVIVTKNESKSSPLKLSVSGYTKTDANTKAKDAEKLANVIAALKSTYISNDANKDKSPQEWDSSIKLLNSGDQTQAAKLWIGGTFANDLGNEAKVKSIASTSPTSAEATEIVLTLTIGLGSADAQTKDITITGLPSHDSKIQKSDKEKLNAVIATLKNTYEATNVHKNNTPQEWQTWADALKDVDNTVSVREWIGGTFSDDLGNEAIVKLIEATAPADNDATSILLSLKISLGTAEVQIKVITVSPLISYEVKNAQADVDAIEAALKKFVDKSTKATTSYPSESNNYSSVAAFLEDINENNLELKRTTLLFNNFINNVATGIKTFDITISKTGATNKTVSFTVKGFKIADSKAKAWYDQWASRTDWEIKQYSTSPSQLGLTRGTTKFHWDNGNNFKEKFNSVLTTSLNDSETPTTLDEYTPMFEIEEIQTNAEATTLKVEYYLTKVVNDTTTYFNADGTEADALEKITKSSLNLSGMVSDIDQLKAQAANLMTINSGAGLSGTPDIKLAEWKERFKTIEVNADNIHTQIATGIFSSLSNGINPIDNPKTGARARGVPTAITLFDSNAVDDYEKIKSFMANPETKKWLTNQYNRIKVHVFAITLTLNGTSYDAIMGALNGRATSADAENNEIHRTWLLTKSRTAQEAADPSVPYEDQRE
ncbi:hypothetical protein EI74_0793 [Mycoplasma testudineum]|uniref:Lipoprotein-associated protein n=1 Tax=Mycoplasma testudineum TaxID=244584 RepID=A0A4R6IB39_9MOLU|nr:hypothetical protein [Mycoplasma testudineum]OYD26520.1 hypothetical protein CG473_03320 [Mycoplasma testudineum]TDO19142.1 hypothetical protein EI74_0793 [Mycoplasma testudineum]